MIMRTLQLPDGRLKILAQALIKGTIMEFLQDSPCFKVRVQLIREEELDEISVDDEALIRHVREQAEKMFTLKGVLTPEMGAILTSVNEPGRLAEPQQTGCVDGLGDRRMCRNFAGQKLEQPDLEQRREHRIEPLHRLSGQLPQDGYEPVVPAQRPVAK
jgi:ATP-dependent Lon protease